jgi:membrane peptidoglycan carboxypeptidase
MYRQMGLFQAPQVPLETAHPVAAETLTDAPTAALGSGEIRVSPLQMALAAASLSGNGVRPLPSLTLAVLTSHQGWVILPASESQAAFSQDSAQETTTALIMPGSPLWGSFGNAQTDKGEITWYLSGTVPGWKDTPLALALVLEEDNPLLAQQIGSKLLKATLNF